MELSKLHLALCFFILLLQSCSCQSARLTERPVTLLYSHEEQLGSNGLDRKPLQISGYFKLRRPVSTYDGHMFYMFFESREMNSSDPVVLWMTGGPGCSSELALFEGGTT